MFRLSTISFCLALITATSGWAQSATDFREAISAARTASVAVRFDDPAGKSGPISERERLGELRQWAGDRFSIEAWIPDGVGWASRSSRAGFAVADDTIITAQIPSSIRQVTVTTPDGRDVSGRVIARDHVTGMTAVRVENAEFDPLPVAAELISPGLPAVVTWLRRGGYATSRHVMIASEPSPDPAEMGFTYELDGDLSGPAVGAAVVDAGGVVIGVAVSPFHPASRRPANLRCIPSSIVSRMIKTALRDTPEDLARGRIGIQFDAGSANVTQVIPGLPGDQAGIKVGDRITKVGRYQINDSTEVLAAVAMARAGDELEIVLRRNGGQKRSTVKLRRQDPAAGRWETPPAAGPLGGVGSERAFRLEDGNLVPMDAESRARMIEEIRRQLQQVPGLNLDYLPPLQPENPTEGDGREDKAPEPRSENEPSPERPQSQRGEDEPTIKDLDEPLQQVQRQLGKQQSE
jgi:S1-C subfamily serine protease